MTVKRPGDGDKKPRKRRSMNERAKAKAGKKQNLTEAIADLDLEGEAAIPVARSPKKQKLRNPATEKIPRIPKRPPRSQEVDESDEETGELSPRRIVKLEGECEIVHLRRMGYPIAAIAAKTGETEATVQRTLKNYIKHLKAYAIENAEVLRVEQYDRFEFLYRLGLECFEETRRADALGNCLKAIAHICDLYGLNLPGSKNNDDIIDAITALSRVGVLPIGTVRDVSRLIGEFKNSVSAVLAPRTINVESSAETDETA